ncbi:DNA internalization-related competence protein ComEC/Rec2 [Shewanella maritima]|uniref:DNA internalization-related competence protein ComEC/Rec2 n=1 Tax=Shewanella maritima TaxID=2520507 RepID=UPI0037364BD8
MNRFIYGYCLCCLSALIWPNIPHISWVIPCLIIAACLLKRAAFISGLLIAMCWISTVFYGLYPAQKSDHLSLQAAEKPQQLEFRAEIVSLVSQNRDYISIDVKPLVQANDSTLSYILPQYYRLSWRNPEEVRVGEQWVFTARLKSISNIGNVGGFNQQKYFISQHIVARGNIKQGKRLTQSHTFKSTLSHFLTVRLHNLANGDILQAILLGDKYAISTERWQQLRQTGSGHLIAISGLHLSVVFGLFYFIFNLIFKQVFITKAAKGLTQHRQVIVMMLALSITLFYAYLAGFAVATQRAAVMLSLVVLLTAFRQYTTSWDRLLYALFAVLLIDPFAVLSAGFFLSFGALAVILFTVSSQHNKQEIPWGQADAINSDNRQVFADDKGSYRPKLFSWLLSYWQTLWAIQWRIALMLGLLQAILFASVSPHSIWLNLLFVPWFSVVVIPLAILSMLLMIAAWLLSHAILLVGFDVFDSLTWHTLDNFTFYFADLSLHPYSTILALSDHLPQAQIALSQQATAIMLTAVIMLVMLYLYPWLNQRFKLYWQALIGFLGLPLVWFTLTNQESPETFSEAVTAQFNRDWQMHTLDVGQGSAIVFQRGNRALLYDTGARYGSSFSYAERVILPFLNARGITHIDYIIVSHDDNDHVGGLTRLLAHAPNAIIIADAKIQAQYLSHDLSKTHRMSAQAADCYQLKLEWQGIKFTGVNPNIGFFTTDNNRSCVVNVSDGKHQVLLTGDIEQAREQNLLQFAVPSIDADIMFVPHHGSRSSSSAALIEAISPQIAIVTAGFANQFGFPKNDILQVYSEQQVPVLRTGELGQISINFTQSGYQVSSYRQNMSPFWYNRLFKFGEGVKAE